MSILDKTIKLAVGTAVLATSVLLPVGAFAATPTDTDPAHHTTNLSDPDPAHHRPFVYCSASTSDCVTVAVLGFDSNGYPTSTSGGGTGTGGTGTTTPPTTTPVPVADTDPAHHSTNLSDPDPVHHQPTVVNGQLVAIPGFDLNGYPVHEDFFA